MRWRWFTGRLFFALILMGNGVSPAGAQECASPNLGYHALYTAIYNLADMTGGYNETAGDDAIPEPSPSTTFFMKSVAAYIWGLPLVEMRRTQSDITDRYNLEPNDLFTPENRNTDTSVVAPNLDVLNATGFFDFSTVDAFVLTVPDTVDTFNVMQLVDAYTNVKGSFGTRFALDDDNFDCHPDMVPPLSNAGGHFLISGPTYDGGIPASLEGDIIGECYVDTNQAWLIGRMAVDAYAENTSAPYAMMFLQPDDPLRLSQSRSYTYAYHLTPLETFDPNDEATWTPTVRDEREARTSEDPVGHAMFGDNIGEPVVPFEGPPYWAPQDFFWYLGDSVLQNGITAGNVRIFGDFSDLGLTTDGYSPPLDPNDKDTMNGAVLRASQFVGWLQENVNTLGDAPAGQTWSIETSLGNYMCPLPQTPSQQTTGWLTAAIIAAVGLGANLGEDGIYPLTLNSLNPDDDHQHTLSGTYTYTLTFGPDEAPKLTPDGATGSPAGFWSLTIYDAAGNIFLDGGLVNDFYGAKVFSLGSMQLANILGEAPVTSEVTFYLQSEPPADATKLRYWLPVPPGPGHFQVMMRIYFPDMAEFSVPYDPQTDYVPPNIFRVPEPALVFLQAAALLTLLGMRRRVR